MKTESFENLFKKSMRGQSLNRLELARLNQLIRNSGKGQTRRALLRHRFSVENRDPEQGAGGSSNVVQLGKSLESRRGNHSIIKSSVASIFLVLVVLLALPIWVSQPLIQKISEEMTFNHMKSYEPEYFGEHISEVTANMSKLNFGAVWPEKLNPDRWSILGGRYCSVQGQVALQVKVKNRETGEISTLYQSAFPKSLKFKGQQKEAVYLSGGHQVDLWREQGNLMGLVREQEDLPVLPTGRP